VASRSTTRRPRCTRRLRDRGIAAGRTGDLGRYRRWEPAGHAGRRQNVDQRRPKITGLPKNAWVSSVEPAIFRPARSTRRLISIRSRHAAYAYKSTDFGATWTPVVAPDSPVRGYAHVIKEDWSIQPAVSRTELGLWVSVDGGKQWAHYKGGDLPAVAVRDLRSIPRDHDLVIGRTDAGSGSSTTSRRSGR